MVKGFRELGPTISSIYKELGLEVHYTLGILKQKWPILVGPEIALHSEPTFLKEGELLIKVRSHAWAQELNFWRDTLLERLKPYKVRGLRFRIGKLRSLKNEKIKSSVVKGTAEVQTKGLRDIPQAEKEFIEASVSSLLDEGLKDSIKRAMEKAFGRAQKVRRALNQDDP